MASTPLRPTAAALARYPIPAGLIASLYRADEGEFAALVAPLSEYARARIAAYCVEKERLHLLALKVASNCAEAVLVKAAGVEIGAALFAQSRVEEVIQTALHPVPAQEPMTAPMQIIEFAAADWMSDADECSEAA
ncbi:hypothetical protein [Methylobacterium soli]|uniref:hypothetical protein n=1 Tax=Methylobacterium soli TaxID=553447 RepID=UPI001EE2EA21|nr:hypothetical protein [Methylobacterium soli]GJE43695.1 hypothetical protein AEGHOMDF_2874 [Methylobacterium soli]